MSRSPRVPSPLWVLLPGLLLALLAGRAVLAEIERAETEARARARAAAARLARAAETLIREAAEPLPGSERAVTREEASAALQHLRPRWAVSRSGEWLELAPLAGPPESDRALVDDALEHVEELRESAGPAAAAAVAAAAAQSARSTPARTHLQLLAARIDASEGDPANALRLVSALLAHSPRDVDAVSGSVRGESNYLGALLLALDLLDREESASAPTPEWLLAAHAHVVRNRFGLEEGVRHELNGRIGALLRGDLGATAHHDADLWRRIRAGQYLNERHGGSALRVGMQPARNDRNDLVRHVWVQRLARVELEASVEELWLGGEIPAFVERLAPEAQALADEEDLAGVALFSPWGRVLIASDTNAWPDPGGPEDDLRQAVRLDLEPGDASLSGWRAEAVAAPPTGIPRGAALLGIAVLVTTVALGWGAFALRRATAEYAQLAEDRRTFLDHVAHEIRTPSSALLALSEELNSGHVPAERRPEYEQHLLGESRRLARLVEETLDLTRLDSDRLAARRERVDLCTIVRAAIGESDGEVSLQIPDEHVAVDADAGALRRCVRNLIDNAHRHGAGEHPPEVRVNSAGGEAHLTVRDHGPGVSTEHAERIFERFYRVPSPTHEVKGVGLGLALCREVARAHGGDVRLAEKATGGGATFLLTLPLAEPTP